MRIIFSLLLGIALLYFSIQMLKYNGGYMDQTMFSHVRVPSENE